MRQTKVFAKDALKFSQKMHCFHIFSNPLTPCSPNGTEFYHYYAGGGGEGALLLLCQVEMEDSLILPVCRRCLNMFFSKIVVG